MKGFYRAAAVAVLAFGSASAVQAQALPAASEVIAKYVEAIGGRDAIMKIKSMRMIQQMELPAMGLSADVEVNAAAPNMTTTKATIPGLGEMLTGFNGTVGWEVNPMQGPRVIADKELEQAKEQADFYGTLLFPAELYSKMETLEQVDFNGQKANKVKLVRKGSGRETTQYFSVANGLLIGSESTMESAMGTMQMQAKINDYKTVDGIKVPAKIEQTAGTNTIVMTLKEVTFNTVPATQFEVPAAVKPLISK